MHSYSMGGADAETSPQEVSQSLQNTLVMMQANKEKDTGVDGLTTPPGNKNKRNLLLFLPIIHFLTYQNTHKHFKKGDCREQIDRLLL